MTSAMTFDDFIGIVCAKCPWMKNAEVEWSQDVYGFKASHSVKGFCEYGLGGWSFSFGRGCEAHGLPTLREAMEAEAKLVLDSRRHK